MGVEDGGRKRGEKGEDGGGCGLLVALPSRSPAGGGKDCSRLCLLLSGASSLPASLPSGGNPADAPALRASESVTPKERRRAGRSRASFVLPPAGGQKQSSSVRPSPRSRRHGKARLVCSTRMPRNASATQGSWNSRRNLASATHAPTRTHTSLHGRAACIRRKTDWPGPVCSVRQRFPARVGLLPPSSGAFAIHRQPTSDDVGLQATAGCVLVRFRRPGRHLFCALPCPPQQASVGSRALRNRQSAVAPPAGDDIRLSSQPPLIYVPSLSLPRLASTMNSRGSYRRPPQFLSSSGKRTQPHTWRRRRWPPPRRQRPPPACCFSRSHQMSVPVCHSFRRRERAGWMWPWGRERGAHMSVGATSDDGVQLRATCVACGCAPCLSLSLSA